MRAWLALAGLGLAAAAFVAASEAEAIVAAVTPTGGSTLTALFGFGQLTGIGNFTTTDQTLAAWAGAVSPLSPLSAVHAPHDLYLWLYSYLGFDLLLVAGYAVTGFLLLPRRRLDSGYFPRLPKDTEPALLLLRVLVALHVAQDVIAAVVFGVLPRRWEPLSLALHFAAAAKWLAALVLLVRVAYLAWDTGAGRQAVSSVVSALWLQRFSVVLVTLVTVIAAGRGLSGILDQMPDVPRAWLAGSGWEPALVAVTAEALLAVLLVFLGRMRTRYAADKYSGTDRRRDPAYLPWLAVPVVLLVLAVPLRLGGYAEVGWARLAVAAALPLAIAVSSLAIAWFSPKSPERKLAELWSWLRNRIWGEGVKPVTDYLELGPDGMPALGHSLPRLPEDAAARKAAAAGKVASVRTAGDALAVAAVAIPGLGLVRSFTAPALLVGGWYAAASWALVALGFAFATLTWPAANGPGRALLRRLAGPYQADARRSLLARLANRARQGPQPGSAWANYWPWLVVGAPFLIAVGWLLFWPLSAAHWLGVLGTVVIALGTLTVVLAVLAYIAQSRRPVPLFRMLRLNVTPVLSVTLAVGILGGVVDTGSLLHVTRGPVQAGTAAEPWGAPGTTFLDALHAWLPGGADDVAVCALPTGNARLRVQPLILAAAAGGGIRAAWWTESAMAKFAATPCGRHDVFAVSSVSGGSVGMAVLASEQDASDAAAAAGADMTRVAGPDALAAGLDGLLLHDLIAGFTGLDLPAAQLPAGQPFADRAGLIESAWSNEDPLLRQPFPLKQPALPWQLLFNSTTVGTGCRAVIAGAALPAAPATLPPPPAGSSPLTCDLQTSVAGGGSYDFFARLGCQRGIATATAAMLSARFPFVTPSGVVTGCGAEQGVPVGQFVDGGYADSSGLITIADLIPAITSELRAYNAQALAQAGRSGQPATIVVPLVMYLGNSARPAAVPAPVPPLTAEPNLVLSTQSAAAASLLTSDTLLQRIGGMIGDGQWLACPPGDAACGAAVRQASQTVGDQLFLVAPGVVPQISAPLGWVLSPASQDALTKALDREAGYRCAPDENAPAGVCEQGVGHLGDLLALTSR